MVPDLGSSAHCPWVEKVAEVLIQGRNVLVGRGRTGSYRRPRSPPSRRGGPSAAVRGPAGEQIERLRRSGSGLGGVGEDLEAGIGADREALVGDRELADERVGGAIAILALSGVVPSTRSPVVLRNPAALGLLRAGQRSTVSALSLPGRITVQAWGTSSDNPTRRLARPSPDYLRPESRALTTGLRTGKEATGARFGVLISVTAREELEVLVNTGLVFEQEAVSHQQNLAIAAGTIIKADTARPVARALPAWCLNRRSRPPRGERVRPTALIMPVTATMDQATVWNVAERTPEGLGARA